MNAKEYAHRLNTTLRTYDAHMTPQADRQWIDENPGKFDGIAQRIAKECPKGMRRLECPRNPNLGCDCGFYPPRNIEGE